MNSELNIFANQINNVNICILDGKKEANFPAMRWKDTINNMLEMDKWKKKLYEVNDERRY